MKPILKKLIPSHPTYDHLQLIIDGIAETVLSEHKRKPDVIIGVSRGGLIAAVRASHLLRVPMIPVSYSSKDGAGDDRNHNNTLPELKGKKILIVDDIADSGHTLKELVDHYSNDNKVETAALYYKVSSVLEPTYYGYPIDDDFGWVVFPWED